MSLCRRRHTFRVKHADFAAVVKAAAIRVLAISIAAWEYADVSVGPHCNVIVLVTIFLLMLFLISVVLRFPTIVVTPGRRHCELGWFRFGGDRRIERDPR